MRAGVFFGENVALEFAADLRVGAETAAEVYVIAVDRILFRNLHPRR